MVGTCRTMHASFKIDHGNVKYIIDMNGLPGLSAMFIFLPVIIHA